jgi:hypothetical protein
LVLVVLVKVLGPIPDHPQPDQDILHQQPELLEVTVKYMLQVLVQDLQ